MLLISFFPQEIIEKCDGFIILYSVTDKSSLNKAEQFLCMLQDMDLIRSSCCILVGG